jgi:cyclopropane fatty-acyl-phospholipid synthase-like methyltransferase
VELSKKLIKRLNLSPSQRLLNFGCATGGSSFHISEVLYSKKNEIFNL